MPKPKDALCNISGEVVSISPGGRAMDLLIPVSCLNSGCRLRPFCSGSALVIRLAVPPQQPEGTGAQPARITPEGFNMSAYDGSRDAGGSSISPSRSQIRP